MIIGIDGNEANVTNQVGVSVYTSQLLSHFAKKADTDHRFVVYLRQAPLSSMPNAHEYFRYEIVKGPALWSQIFLPLHLYLKKQIDVFFAPAHYAPRFCPVPIVVTIHDLSFFYFPDEFLKKDLYQLTNWTKYSVEKAKKLIAVSKTTKKDVMKLYGKTEHDIAVVYNGFEKPIKSTAQSDILKEYDLKRNQYILYVGTIQPRKNIRTLIRAFTTFSQTHPEFKLVITGKKGWLFEETIEEAKALQEKGQIILTGYESDENVVTLYKNAYCYALPSLYEGFGIPVLEAMSNSCPVVTSHASSLAEIGGNACLYFDPRDPADLVEKFEQLYDNSKLRQELIKKGKERITQFSWQKCADETLDIIKSV